MTDTIEIKKDTLWKASTLVLLLVVVGMVIPWGESEAGINGNAVKGGSNNGGKINMDDLADDDAFKGDKDAPVTIVEWSDFGCFFCERFYSETLGLIEENYIETGKVKLVYRDFPWEAAHPGAGKAAEAAECAREQGKFWEMHDTIFEDGISGGVGGVTAFKQYAINLGLNTENFNSCLDSGKFAKEVEKDMQDGRAAGISGTPGFIINGKLVSGAQPFSVFQQAIEAELA